MSVTFKKILRKSPLDKQSTGKYYPQLIVWGKAATLETLAKQMKENSSLTLGDIKSVITNFVEAMRIQLYNGHSVNIENFGVFSLSASTTGTEKKKDCLPENIQAIRIRFRASNGIRPVLTRGQNDENRIDFVDLEAQLKAAGEPEGGDPGGGDPGGDGEAPDPSA